MSSYSDFDQRARRGERLTVVFLGGSLTWGAQATNPQETSYRARVSRRLEEQYSQARFRFWDAAIGGTGSQLAAFRLDRDVLAQRPDLVFLDFTVNDDPYATPDADRLASYESLVRRLTLAGVPVVQVILPTKQDVLLEPPARPLDTAHRNIGCAYGLAVADAVALVRDRVGKGEAAADLLWDAVPDTVHPGDAGYALFAEAAWAAYAAAIGGGARPKAPETMLHADTYMATHRFRLASLPVLPGGWTVAKPQRSALAYDFVPSRWMDDVVVASASRAKAMPEPFALTVRACTVLLFGEETPSSGRYRVRIDGGTAVDYDGAVLRGGGRYVQIVARDLDPRRDHTLEIVPDLEPGRELRLESVCTAGGSVH